MKILLLAYYYPPLALAGGERPLKIAKYLERFNHEVFILTATYCKNSAFDDNIIRIYDPSHNNNRKRLRKLQWFFLRGITELANALGIYFSIYTLWKKKVVRRSGAIIRSLQPDLILATYPPVETLEIGLHLSRKYKLPLIADFRDGLLFEAIEENRLRRFACVRKTYSVIERHVASEAAALLTVSEPISDYFRETYKHPCVKTIANGFDPDESQMPVPTITLESGCFHIVHSGRFALSDAGCTILPLVQALNSLLAERPELVRSIRLHLLGALSRKEIRMLADLVQRGVVRIHGALSRPQALAFQRRADLLLLVTSPNRRSVATTKIFEYLQARRPILALTPRSFAAEIVEKSRCGWVVQPLAVNEIGLILKRIIDDRAFYQDVDLSAAAIGDYSITVSLGYLNELLHAMDKNPPA